MLWVAALLWIAAYAEVPQLTPDPGACPPADTGSGDDAVDRAQRLVVERINLADGDGLFALWSPAMRDAVPLEATRALVTGMLDARGCLVTSERVTGGGSQATYRVVAERGEWQVQIATDPDGQLVLGLGISDPPAPPPPVAEMGDLVLPVTGEWLVFWGGPTREVNHHVDHASQRRAADLLKVDAEGRSCRGEALADCLCYGERVLAVADGIVETVVDGVPDSVLGVPNEYSAIGNAVILRHADDRFSVYAHLQPGSIRVKVGKRVVAGQFLGLVGNSGHSTEPHLHFQVQDGPRFESSWGVEAVFDAVRVGGEPVEGWRFHKGDHVSPP